MKTPKNHARELEGALDGMSRTLGRALTRARTLAPRNSDMMQMRAELEELDRELARALNTIRSGAVAIYELRATTSTVVPPGYVALGDRLWRGDMVANGWLAKLFGDLQAARAAESLEQFLGATKNLTTEKPVEGFQKPGASPRKSRSRFGNFGMGRM